MSHPESFRIDIMGSEPGAGTPDPIYTASNSDISGGVVEPCPNAKKDPKPSVKPITIRASLFFDGTLNNRNNTRWRKIGNNPKDLDDSYQNDESNVAKLEASLVKQPDTEVKYSFKTYIEGIGTTDFNDDTLRGYAFGTGDTGVEGKVDKGFEDVITNIISCVKNKDLKPPLTIHIDAFGFSRGAAAARFFVYQILTHKRYQSLKIQLTKKGYVVNEVKVKFMGLFDTVASFGLNHDDDTAELHLNSVSDGRVEKVVHLASADEHRENFPLTDISSKGSLEIFLPGVHSDIGGGYKDGDGEDIVIYEIPSPGFVTPMKKLEYLNAEKARLIKEGWYREKELFLSTSLISLEAKRNSISNHYARIPFHIMLEKASKTGLQFSSRAKLENEIPASLATVNQLIMSYVAASEAKKSTINDWKNNAAINSIRHDYFHFSAHFNGIGMDPNIENGTRTRQILPG